MSRSTFTATLVAGLIAATAVAGQRIGLALAVTLLFLLGIAAQAASTARARIAVGIGVALAVQPVLRDAGCVVVVATLGAVVAMSAAVVQPQRWLELRCVLLTPVRWMAGHALVRQTASAMASGHAGGTGSAMIRGGVLALGLTAAFGALLASADRAFSEFAGGLFTFDFDGPMLLWRVVLGAGVVVTGGALAAATRTRPAGPGGEPWAPGRTELRIALGALTVLFGVFVAIQLRVLFGGADYVRSTTGLGYGDYARQGFVQLLATTGLTLAVVGIAARRRDAVVRALLGCICALLLVVLFSAEHRLGLVEDVYGLTRVRFGGHAVVYFLAAVITLVIVAGLSAAVARLAPTAAVLLALTSALGFCLANPDARIAERAVGLAADGRPVDVHYLSGLSADALPALRELPQRDRGQVVMALEERLRRDDGVAGFNVSRERARR